MSSVFLSALKRQATPYTPIWIMRQAGRYLPEYRAVRELAGSFMALCQTPELACQVTLQPLKRFPLDAAIIFSDILTIPHALKLGLHFKEGEGPVFAKKTTPDNFSQLGQLDLNDLAYVYQAISLTKSELPAHIPLIGFCGSPWTLAAYMIEGRSVPGFPGIQTWKNQNPNSLNQLLQHLSKAVANHLIEQAKAGADVLMIFDTWGNLLNADNYFTFSLSHMNHIIRSIRDNPITAEKPIILFTKETGNFISEMIRSGCDAIGVDHSTSLTQAKYLVQNKVALQGNLDPHILLSEPKRIRAEVAKILAEFGKDPGHIFNLGHGITPNVPPEHVSELVQAVHELSKPYHEHTPA